MTFQAWKMIFQNCMIFQVFHDSYEPCQTSVKFVGNTVDSDGVHVRADPEKVEAILQMKAPKKPRLSCDDLWEW